MKKMEFLKKVLACVLCMLMLASVCAFAEETAAEAVEIVELTDEQLAALDNLPEGFSRDAVAAEMMRSKACKHTSFYVAEEVDEDSYVYKYIDQSTHSCSYKIIGRKLYCSLCDKLLQSIKADDTVTDTTIHWWSNDEMPAGNIFKCGGCEQTIQVSWPCKHKQLVVGEDANAYCPICGKMVVLNSLQYLCDHSHRTVYYPDKAFVWYSQWNEKQHVKTTTYYIYEDLSWGIDGDCDECGIWLVCKPNGKIDYSGNTERICTETKDTSALENHVFENGVCACGLEEPYNGEMNPTHYSIALQDTTVTLTPDRNIVELENPMLIVNWAYTLQDGTAFSYTRLIKADDLENLTYDLGLAEAPAGSRLESLTVIITDEQTLDITVAAKGYGYAQF